MCMTCWLTPDDELVSELASQLQTPQNIYEWVRDNVRYFTTNRIDLWQTPRGVILNRYADCDGMSLLISAMLWNQGYKNRVVLAHLRDMDIGHAWVEIFDETGEVIRLDATCKKCKFGQYPKTKDVTIAYVYPEVTEVMDDRLYELYVGNRFQYKYPLECKNCKH